MSQVDGSPIRLALLDDQTMFREGLSALIEREADFETIAEASTIQALAALDIADSPCPTAAAAS
jgi:DNA-binding NarL/FixJ family response regulator